MDYVIKNGSANLTKVYAIDDVDNGIDECFTTKEKAIEAIMWRYTDNIQYMKPWTDGNGREHSVAEQVYEDIKQLKEDGYIDSAYYITEIYIGD